MKVEDEELEDDGWEVVVFEEIGFFLRLGVIEFDD